QGARAPVVLVHALEACQRGVEAMRHGSSSSGMRPRCSPATVHGSRGHQPSDMTTVRWPAGPHCRTPGAVLQRPPFRRPEPVSEHPSCRGTAADSARRPRTGHFSTRHKEVSMTHRPARRGPLTGPLLKYIPLAAAALLLVTACSPAPADTATPATAQEPTPDVAAAADAALRLPLQDFIVAFHTASLASGHVAGSTYQFPAIWLYAPDGRLHS